MRSLAIVVLLVTAAACSGPPDGAADASAMGPDAHTFDDDYLDPSAFDRIGCTPGSMTGLVPDGTWHQDVAFAGLDFSTAVVLKYATDATGIEATYGGSYLSRDVQLTADDFFTRVTFTNDNGQNRLRVFDACAQAADGSLTGKFAWCNSEDNGNCYTGTFTAVKVTRIPGEPEAQGLGLLGEFNGEPAAPWDSGLTVNVRVHEGLAYLARYQDGLRIVDVSNPAAIQELGWSPTVLVDDNEIYNDVKIVDAATGLFALMASNERGVVAIDVTDPSAPVEVATFPPIPAGESYISVHTLFTETIGGQTRAYSTNQFSGGIDIYDVTDPRTPVRLGGYVHPEVGTDSQAFVHDLYVENGRVYLNYWHQGLVLIDTLADPANPVYLGQYDDYPRRTNHSVWVTTTTGGRKVAVSGDEDWDAHAHVVDVDDASPTFLERVGELSLRPEVSIHNIMAFGDTAYIAWYQDGVRLLDLSDPTQPSLAAFYNTWDGPGVGFYEGAIGLDVDLALGRLYVADTVRGLIILEVL